MFHPLTHSLQKFKYFEVGGNRHFNKKEYTLGIGGAEGHVGQKW